MVKILELASKFSDGDRKFWPAGDYYLAPHDMGYHFALAKKIASKDPHLSLDDDYYQLRDLPDGYAVFHKIGKDKRLDRYLYGHSEGRFDSYLKYYVHFEWLMSGGIGVCYCVRCLRSRAQTKSSTTINSSNPQEVNMTSLAEMSVEPQDDVRPRTVSELVYSSRGRRQTVPENQQRFATLLGQKPQFFHDLNPMQQFSRIVAEATDDPENPVDIYLPWNHFTPFMSQALISQLERIKTRPSFEPRCGEVVLYSRLTSQYRVHSELQTLEIHDSSSAIPTQAGPLLMTEWYVGIVAAVPNHPAKLDDLTSSFDAWPRQMLYRIDGFHNARHPDAKVRAATEIVTLDHIRPFHLFHELQAMNAVKQYCNSFEYGFETTLYISFLEPYECIGRGAVSLFLVRGVYIGTELIIQDDVVRIFGPIDRDVIQRIIVVDEIHVVVTSGMYPPSALVGKEYLSIQTKDTRQHPLDINTEGSLFRSGMEGYTWYPVIYPEGQTRGKAHFNHVVGRQVAKSAMIAMLGSESIDVGGGMAKARDYARGTLARRQSRDPRFEGFYIKECRHEALGVTHVNAVRIKGSHNNKVFTEGMDLKAFSDRLWAHDEEEEYDEFWDLDMDRRD